MYRDKELQVCRVRLHLKAPNNRLPNNQTHGKILLVLSPYPNSLSLNPNWLSQWDAPNFPLFVPPSPPTPSRSLLSPKAPPWARRWGSQGSLSEQVGGEVIAPPQWSWHFWNPEAPRRRGGPPNTCPVRASLTKPPPPWLRSLISFLRRALC